MPVPVVHAAEVVDVQHDQTDAAVPHVRRAQLSRQALVKVAVVVQRREVVGDHLGLEAGPDTRVVDGERGHPGEGLRQPEFLVGEVVVVAQARQAQHADEFIARHQRDGDERLGLDGRARDLPSARIEVRVVRQDGGPGLGGHAGDSGAVGDRSHRQDLLDVGVAHQHRTQHAQRIRNGTWTDLDPSFADRRPRPRRRGRARPRTAGAGRSRTGARRAEVGRRGRQPSEGSVA